MPQQELVGKICALVLQHPKGMIREQDIENICENEEQFLNIIPEVVKNFQQIGLSLVRTTYQNDRFYVLTSSGKDEFVSPSMYGALGLVIGIVNEIGSDLDLPTAKRLFQEIWSDIQALIEQNYLQIQLENGKEFLRISPIGKASFKTVIKEMDLKKIFSLLPEKA